jgi:hypothetical protein
MRVLHYVEEMRVHRTATKTCFFGFMGSFLVTQNDQTGGPAALQLIRAPQIVSQHCASGCLYRRNLSHY